MLAGEPSAQKVVAGLPLAARTVLALRAAGVARVAVKVGGSAPALRRVLERRAVDVQWLVPGEPVQGLAGDEPVLVLRGDILVDGEALEAVLASSAGPGVTPVVPAEDARGQAIAALVPGPWVPALLGAAEAGGRSLLEILARAGVPIAPPIVVREGVLLTPGTGGFRRLEVRLLDHLARRTVTGDSYLAALVDRRLSRPLTRLLLRTPLSPAAITLTSVAIGLLGALGLATTSHGARVAGAIALLVSVVLDCVDGEVARARLEQSVAGARLDVAGDYVVHLAAFAGLGVGLAREGLSPLGRYAVPGLVLGVAAAMLVVHAAFVRPALDRGGDLHWAGDGESLHGTPGGALIEKLASRDYTYLLLLLALLGRLEWFLYAAALGVWVFVAAVSGYRAVALTGRRRRAPVEEGSPR